MKKGIIKITILFLIIMVGIISFIPFEYVDAQTVSGATVQSNAESQGSSGWGWGWKSLVDAVNAVAATFANTLMAVAGAILAGAGTILDVSIRLTLNIKDFVEATPEIYIVWKVIRDITGLCFIFFLLYAAIQMMTGIGKGPGYAATIKNIVIAGILINFSFFITSVAIDASNVVSQAIYNAMIPNSVTMKIDQNTGLAEMVKNNGKSTISNVFMNSLRIQSIYDSKGNRLGTEIGNPVKIFIIGIFGVMMMLTTAASFVLASMAFIARLVILLFLLAFSSLWFAGTVIPQLSKHISKFTGQLFAQLTFMPVYLLLMYVALRIINGSKIFNTGEIMNNVSATGTNWMMPFIILFVNFAIVIFILNLPLAVGLAMGGMATDWLKKYTEKFDAINMWKGLGGIVGTNTIGRSASYLDKKFADTRLGNTIGGRVARANTIGALAGSKFGGAEKWEDKVKAKKERMTKSGEIHRKIAFNKAFTYAQREEDLPEGAKTLGDSLKGMTTKEKLALGTKTLKNEHIIKHLSSGDFKAIKEDKDNLFSEQDKKEISDARYKALKDVVGKKTNNRTPEDTKTIKNMVSEMDGKELMKLDDSVLFDPEVIKNIKISQLKTMNEEGWGSERRVERRARMIQEIQNLGSSGHSAYGLIKSWAKADRAGERQGQEENALQNEDWT